MKISFVKMQGTGNDFILIDEFRKVLVPEAKKPAFVRKISDRHFGIGSDGVIFIQKSKKADAKFNFFNPDGSKAEMCGNGIRCLAKYLYEHNLVKKREIEVETLAGIIVLKLTTVNGRIKSVRVDMGSPRLKRKDIPVRGKPNSSVINKPLTIDGKKFKITAVGMGNPHAVLFVNNVGKVDVVNLGRKIRHHKLFPRGTNVHFVQKLGINKFKIRTYERGVESETLACGTGICASAVAGALNKKANPERPVTVVARGGALKVELATKKGEITKVFLIGPAEEIFSGEILF